MRFGNSPFAQIRGGNAEDALCVSVLAMQVFLETYATEGIRPDLAREVLATYAPEAFAERLRDPSTVFLLAERAGHLVGFAEVRCGRAHPGMADPAAAELVRLYVQGRSKRHGLGSALLANAEAEARRRSADTLWLTVWSDNDSAMAFYTAMGYEKVGTTRYAFQGNAYENVVMQRALPNAT